MSSPFFISCEWLPDDVGDASEHSALAEIAIYVGGRCATEVEDVFGKTVRPSARPLRVQTGGVDRFQLVAAAVGA